MNIFIKIILWLVFGFHVELKVINLKPATEVNRTADKTADILPNVFFMPKLIIKIIIWNRN